MIIQTHIVIPDKRRIAPCDPGSIAQQISIVANEQWIPAFAGMTME
jgi:hypothetical protein